MNFHQSHHVGAEIRGNSFITRDGLKLTVNIRYYQPFLEAGPEYVVRMIRQRNGLIFKNGSKSTVFSLRLNKNGLPKKMMVKRYIHTDPYRVLKVLFKASRAKRSWQVSWKFLHAGISVPVPILLGEKRICRFLRESFIVTEEIEAEDLRTYFGKLNPPATPEKIKLKQQLITDFARTLRQAHDRGFSSDDLKASNILVRRENDKMYFWFLDFDGAEWKRRISRRRTVKNFLDLNKSLSDMISEQDRLEFLEKYATGNTDFLRDISGRLNKILSCNEKRGFAEND